MITLKKCFRIYLFVFCYFLTSCGVLDAPIKAYKSAKNYVFPPGEKAIGNPRYFDKRKCKYGLSYRD